MAEFDLWIVEHGHLLNGSTQDWGRTHMWHGQCFPKVDSAPTEGRDVGLGEEGEQRVEEGQEGQEEQASDTDGEQADGAPAEDASAEEGERNHEQPR